MSTAVKEPPMIYWAVVFFIVAIVAAIFGFGGIAGESAIRRHPSGDR